MVANKVMPAIQSVASLTHEEIPEMRWAVPNFIPEGLTVLAGKQKSGKSYMLLNLGVAVATGGHALGKVKVEQGEVLYLALEDSPRRMQVRLRQIMQGAAFPRDMYVAYSWDRLSNKGEKWRSDTENMGTQWLDTFLEDHKNVRLVIIDVLAKVSPPERANSDQYQPSYDLLGPLHDIGLDRRVGIVVVTHARKQNGSSLNGDIQDEIRGSAGQAGVADAIVILKKGARVGQKATLYVSGRDIQDIEYDVEFQPEIGTWSLLDTPIIDMTPRLANESQRLLDAIRAQPNISRAELAQRLNKSLENIDRTGGVLVDRGLVTRSRGKYTITAVNTSTQPYRNEDGMIEDDEFYEDDEDVARIPA